MACKLFSSIRSDDHNLNAFMVDHLAGNRLIVVHPNVNVPFHLRVPSYCRQAAGGASTAKRRKFLFLTRPGLA
jgi:hypothetical protein